MIRRDFSVCPRCGAPTVQSISISGAPSEFWRQCTKCPTYINTYIPQAHQLAVHKDSHRFIGNFGGYGTGKTTTSREEFYKHLFLTPNGNTLIGANVASQYEQTIKRDIEQDIPRDFVENVSVQKSYIDFINGHRLMFRPFDNADKMRSYNIDMFIVVEASEVSPDVYAQLKTRLRNMAATVPERDEKGHPVVEYTPEGVPIPKVKADWRVGIIESNPDSGWIKNDVLMVSSEIHKHGNIFDVYDVPENEKDKYTSSHVATTSVNRFLPKDFLEEITKNKPMWWVNRYINGSFSYAEGLVYPRASECIVPTFIVPKEWKRIIAFDYGLSDDAVFLFGALDEANGLLYIYKEVRVNNRNVEDLAKLYFKHTKDIPQGGLLTQPIIDPKSGPKRDYQKKSLADYFLDYGICFKPGYINVNARVYRLNTYIESGKLKIMDCCEGLIKELKNYKFPSKQIGKHTPDKPVDKDNHAINPLEWIVMDLPADPKRLMYGVYNRHGQDVSAINRDEYKYRYYALSDENEFNDYMDAESLYGIIDYTNL
jgi:phage terminase large subunit